MIDNWKLVVTQRYAKFDGRADRAEYWWFFLANMIVYLVSFTLAQASNIFYVLYFIWAAALIVPSIAIAVRRLHDSNKTGWLLLLAFIPIAGPIIILVFMVLPSDRAPNQFGIAAESTA